MTRDRALHHLGAVRRETERVSGVAGMWSDAATSADDRIALRAEWSNVLDRFSVVVEAHGLGELAPDVETQLFEVARLVARLAPMLDAMQLRRASSADLERLGIQIAV